MPKQNVKRILIIKFWAIGDILMATPLLTALKSAFPECSISWLVDSKYAGALENNDLLDTIIPFDSAPWRKDFRYGNFPRYLRTSFRIVKLLRSYDFDLVINLTPDKWWCLWFNVGKKSVGLFPCDRPGFLGKFYDHVIPLPSGDKVHNTDHFLRPMKSLGADGPYDRQIVFSISSENQDWANRFLNSQHLFDPSVPYVILHPGTSQQTKCWPLENFARLADLLYPRYQIVVTGSAEEAELALNIRRLAAGKTQTIIATGECKSFGQSAALVAGATAVVTGDTSILHVASALGTPLVAIYGSTRPNDNAPLFGRNVLLFDNTVDCSPCYKSTCRHVGVGHLACQKAVSPDYVQSQLSLLLGELPFRSGEALKVTN